MSDLVAITDARAHMKDTLAKVESGPIKIIRHSRVAAVMLSSEHYESLLDLIEDLEDQCAVMYAQLHPEESAPWKSGP